MMTNKDFKKYMVSKLDEETSHKIWNNINYKGHKKQNLNLYLKIINGVSVTAIIIFAVLIFIDSSSVLTFKDGKDLPQLLKSGRAKTVILNDGSKLTLSKKSTIEILENKFNLAHLALRKGSVNFNIPEHKNRKWIITAGSVTVTVTGTIFTVDKQDDFITVKVLRGKVLVAGNNVRDKIQQVVANKSLIVPVDSSDEEKSNVTDLKFVAQNDNNKIQKTEYSKEILKQSAADDNINVTADESETARTEKRRFIRAMRHENYEKASLIIFTSDNSKSDNLLYNAGDLFILADFQRKKNYFRKSVEILELILVNKNLKSQWALAAYTLGKVYSDNLHQLKKSSYYIEKSIKLGLNDSLMESALARLVENFKETRDDRLTETVKKYIESYPDGRYSAQFKTLIVE